MNENPDSPLAVGAEGAGSDATDGQVPGSAPEVQRQHPRVVQRQSAALPGTAQSLQHRQEQHLREVRSRTPYEKPPKLELHDLRLQSDRRATETVSLKHFSPHTQRVVPSDGLQLPVLVRDFRHLLARDIPRGVHAAHGPRARDRPRRRASDGARQVQQLVRRRAGVFRQGEFQEKDLHLFHLSFKLSNATSQDLALPNRVGGGRLLFTMSCNSEQSMFSSIH